MTDSKDNGGPAFPRVPFDVNDYTGDGSPGMALRDWFAGNSPLTLNDARAVCSSMAIGSVTAALAGLNYAYADAMLAERNRK